MDTFWGEFVQALLMAFAPILAGLLAAWLVGIVRLVWQRIKVEKPQLGYVLKTSPSPPCGPPNNPGPLVTFRIKSNTLFNTYKTT